MLSVKLLDDYIIKSQDIKVFKIQLLRDGLAYSIGHDCYVKWLVANQRAIVYEDSPTIVDYEKGIIEFQFRAIIGTGSFDCEFIVTNDIDVNLTFPDNGYTVLKISPCLSERPVQTVTPTEYERLNARMDEFVTDVTIFKQDVNSDLSNYANQFSELQGSLDSAIGGFQVELDTKAEAVHGHEIADVNNLETRLSAIEKIQDESQGTHDELEQTVVDNYETLDGKIDENVQALQASIDTNRTEALSSVQNAQETLQGNIDTLSGTVSSNKTELQGNIDTLAGTVNANKTELQTSINNINTTVTNNNATLTNLVESTKTELNNSVVLLSNTVNSNKNMVETLVANNSSNVERIDHILNSVSATETLIDKVNALPDNAGNMVEVTKVQGNTVQNIWSKIIGEPINQGVGATLTLSGDYATVATAQTGYEHGNIVTTFDATLMKPNTTYTLILKELPRTTSAECYFIVRDGTNSTNINNAYVIKEKRMIKFTTLDIPSKQYVFYVQKLFVGDSFKYKNNVMLLEGDWTNRTDIPDYFTEIQSVDSVQVKSVGKNLFDCNKTLVYTNAIKIQEGLPYEAIFPEVSSSNRCRQRELIGVLPNKSYTLTVPSKAKFAIHEFDLNKCHLVDRGWSTATTSFTTTENTRYIFIYMSMNGDSGFKLEEMEKLLKDVQLEENEAATAYEPYQETIMQIPLEEPLRSLPNGVCDSIEDGKIVRNVGKITIDSTHEYIGHLNNDNYISIYFEFKDSFENIKDMENALCNKLPVYAWSTGLGSSLPADKEVLWHHHASSFGLSIEKSKLTDVSYEGAFNYIVANNYEIYAQLKTPIIEDLPIPNDALLQTYQNGHILLESTPVNPKVDVQYAIGLQGKINKLETEMAENEQVVSNINSEIRNMLANETGLQTVNERVNDLVMQDGNIVIENVQGNTVQNLIGKPKQSAGTSTTGNHSERVVITDSKVKVIFAEGDYTGVNWNGRLSAMVKPNTTYSAIVHVYANTMTSGTFQFLETNTNSPWGNSITVNANAGQEEYKGTGLFVIPFTTRDTFTHVNVNSMGSTNCTTGEYIEFTMIVLEGDWTGKEPPAYFTGIKSVNEEQTGLQVRSVGKNLLNIEKLSPSTVMAKYYYENGKSTVVTDNSTSLGRAILSTIRLLPNRTYTLSLDMTVSNYVGGAVVQIRNSNKSYSIVTIREKDGVANAPRHIEFTFTTDYSVVGQDFSLWLYPKTGNTSEAISVTAIYENIQLELNDTATDYEPYKESTITIPYAEPLRRLPNGVADTIEDGKVIRRVGKYTLNGSENWTMGNIGASDTSANITRFYCTNKLVTKEHQDRLCILSDKLPTIDSNAYLYSEGIMQGYGNPYLYIHLDNSKLSELSANAFKTWLQSNPVTVYYELDKYTNESAIVEEIPEITLAGYKHLIFDNDIVPTSATVSFANSNYARLVATEKATASQSSTIADLCAVTDYVVLQNGQQEEAIANISNVINSTINTLVNDAFKDTDMQTYWNSI